MQVEGGSPKQENGNEGKPAVEGLEIKEEQVSEAEVAFEDEDEEQEERLRRLEAGETMEDIDKSIRQQRQPVPATILKVCTVWRVHIL